MPSRSATTSCGTGSRVHSDAVRIARSKSSSCPIKRAAAGSAPTLPAAMVSWFIRTASRAGRDQSADGRAAQLRPQQSVCGSGWPNLPTEGILGVRIKAARQPGVGHSEGADAVEAHHKIAQPRAQDCLIAPPAWTKRLIDRYSVWFVVSGHTRFGVKWVWIRCGRRMARPTAHEVLRGPLLGRFDSGVATDWLVVVDERASHAGTCDSGDRRRRSCISHWRAKMGARSQNGDQRAHDAKG